MPNSNLSILISAELNQGLALRDINTAIKALGKSKNLQKLNLKIDIDDSFVKSINKFIEATGKLNVALASQNKVVQETITEHRKLDGTIERTTEQILKNGEIINKTRVIHDANKKTIQMESQGYEAQVKTLQQLEKELEGYALAKQKANKNAHGQVTSYTNTYKNELGQLINVRTDPSGKVKNYDEVTNYLQQQKDALAQEQAINKQREQIAQEEYKIRKALQDKTEKEQAAHYKELEALDKAHYQALKTNKEREEALEKMHYLALQQNAKREQQYLKSLSDTETKIADIRRRFGNDTNVRSGLGDIESQLNRLKSTGSIGDFKSQFDNINSQLKQVAANAKTATSHTLGFGEAMKTAMTRFPIWIAASTAFYAPLRALQNGIQYIYDLDTAMTNLQKVTDNTAEEYRQFITEAQGVADSIGGLTLDVIKSTTEWARLGYTIKQAKVLAEETLVYQNVGDIDTAEKASEALIATIKGFGVEVDAQGKNIQNVVDIYNEVGNKFAISSAGIGEAMRRSAASLSGAGNTIEQSVAMITAANTTIQDPARVGNALKTISMRIRGVSDDGEDLTKLLPTLEAKFNSVGLSLKKNDNTFKSTYEIFEDLSTVWDRLSDFQQAEFVELVAGKHQGNIAASMIANWKDAQLSLEAGLNSFGSAARENEKYLESMEGRIAKFKNAANAFWSDSISTDFLKSLIDFGTAAIKTLDNLGNTFLIVGGIILTFKSRAITGLISGLSSTITSLFATRAAIVATGNAANTTAVALTGMQRALGIFGLLVSVGSLIYSVFSQTKSSVDQTTESVENLKESITDTSYSISQLESLNEQYKSGNKSQEELLSIREQMRDIMPSIISHYTDEGEAVYKTSQEIDRLIQKEKELLAAKQGRLAMMASEALTQPTQDIVDAMAVVEQAKVEQKLAEASKAAATYVEEFLKNNRITIDQVFDLEDVSKLDKFQSDIEKIFTDRGLSQYDANKFFAAIDWNDSDFTKFVEFINKNFARIDETISLNSAKIDEAKQKFISSFGDINQDLLNSLSSDDQNLKSILDKVAEEYVKSVNINKDNKDLIISNYRKLSRDIATAITSEKIDLSEIFKSGDFTILSNALSGLEKQFPQISTVITDFSNSTKEANKATAELANTVVTLKSQLDNVAKSKTNIQLLNKAQKELKDTNHVSIDTMIELIEVYDDYIDVSNASKEQILDYIEVKKQEEIAVVDAEKAMAKAFINTARVGLLAMKAANSVSLIPIPETTFLAAEQAIDQLEKRLGALDAAAESLKYTAEENNREQENSNETFSETNEILTETQKRLRDIQTELDKLNNKRSKIKRGSAEYRKSLMEEISLLKEQKKLYEEGIANPEKLVSTKITTTTKGTVPSSSAYVPSSSTSTRTTSSGSASGRYASIINQYASQYGVDPRLIAAIIQTESGFNSNAVSSAGAQGLMQLMPKTARGLGVKNSFDPEQNIKGGTSHFARLLDKYDGDVTLALYAYNAGEGNVDKWKKTGQLNNIPFKETRNYAPKVLAAYNSMGGTLSTTTSTTTAPVTASPAASSSGSAKNKITLPSQSELDEAKNNAINTVSQLENTIYNKTIDFINDVVLESNNKLEKFENNISKSETKQSKYSETSKEWRKEEMSQISYLTKQQDELHNQNEKLRQLVKDKQITSGEFDKLMEQNSLKWLEIQEQKQQKTFALFSSSLNEIDEQIQSYGDKIAFSNAKLSTMTEGTEKYNKELLSQIPLLKQQQNLAHKEAELIREQLKKEKLTISQKKELSERLNQLSTDWWDYEASIKGVTSALNNIAFGKITDIFDTLKESLNARDMFDIDEFDDSVDAIIASLDKIDGVHLEGVKFVDTSNQARSELQDYANRVKDIAKQVKTALDFSVDLSNVNFSNLSSLASQITSQVNLIGTLKRDLDKVNNAIRDTELQYRREEDALEDLIKNTEKSYDAQIEKQQEVLENLDEQIEKEDRLKRLQELNDEINKVRNDKRFSYITEAGEEILTYDKARVEELEKEKDELVKQYEREDVKKAVQDEIDRLQKQKDETVQILQEKLERTRQINQQSLEAMRLYQSSLSNLYSQTVTDTQNKLTEYQTALQKGLEEGTISADEGTKLLQLVVDGWQASSLVKWDTYIGQVQSKLSQLRSIYAEMASLAASMNSMNVNPVGASNNGNGKNSSGSSGSNGSFSNSSGSFTSSPGPIQGKVVSVTKKYHTGGEVGEEPLAPNELPSILEMGELVLTKEHQQKLKEMVAQIPRMVNAISDSFKSTLANINVNKPTLAMDSGTTYTFSGPITVKANDPMEFFKGLETHIQSNRK